MELIARTDEAKFGKRKNLLWSVINSGAKCDHAFPEHLIFDAFDAFNDYEFVEDRTNDLLGIVYDVIDRKSLRNFKVR